MRNSLLLLLLIASSFLAGQTSLQSLQVQTPNSNGEIRSITENQGEYLLAGNFTQIGDINSNSLAITYDFENYIAVTGLPPGAIVLYAVRHAGAIYIIAMNVPGGGTQLLRIGSNGVVVLQSSTNMWVPNPFFPISGTTTNRNPLTMCKHNGELWISFNGNGYSGSGISNAQVVIVDANGVIRNSGLVATKANLLWFETQNVRLHTCAGTLVVSGNFDNLNGQQFRGVAQIGPSGTPEVCPWFPFGISGSISSIDYQNGQVIATLAGKLYTSATNFTEVRGIPQILTTGTPQNLFQDGTPFVFNGVTFYGTNAWMCRHWNGFWVTSKSASAEMFNVLGLNAPILVYRPGMAAQGTFFPGRTSWGSIVASNGDLIVFGSLMNGVNNIIRYELPNTFLPVELINFKGEEREGKSFLEWWTETETNVQQFVIEHSVDGITFNEIGIQTANGSGSYYTTEHANPTRGSNYYRLRIEDFDGAISYSNIIEIYIEKRESREAPLKTYFVDGIPQEIADEIKYYIDNSGRSHTEPPNGLSFGVGEDGRAVCGIFSP
jgi:hypothetical protein